MASRVLHCPFILHFLRRPFAAWQVVGCVETGIEMLTFFRVVGFALLVLLCASSGASFNRFSHSMLSLRKLLSSCLKNSAIPSGVFSSIGEAGGGGVFGSGGLSVVSPSGVGGGRSVYLSELALQLDMRVRGGGGWGQ